MFFPSIYPFILEYAIGFRSVDCSTPTSTPYTTTSIPPLHPPPLRFPCRSSSHPIPDNSSASNSSSPDELKTTHSHPTKPNEVEQSPVTPYYTVLGDHSGTNIAAGHPRGLSWDTCGEYWDKRREQRSEDDGAESTPTPSRKCGKKDSDHQSPSTSSFQEFKRSPFVEKDQAMVKQLPNTPAGDSPSRRFWKLVKKISVNGLREKNQSNSDHLPPVPPLPSDIMKNNFPLSRAISTSMLSSSPTTSLDKVYKTTIVPSTPPSTSAQRHTKLPHSAPHSPPSSVPRPSTTTRSSSPSSDVASSRFFNRQSARSSTSSLGEEAIPLPPLPKNSNPIITSKRTNADDANASCEFQQYIIPPSELSPRHSTSNLLSINTTTIAIPSNQTPPSMEDDWTIVQSPSNELEALSLPPPPRQLFKGIDIGVGLDRRKTPSDQESKAKARMRASDVIQNMPAVDIPSEQVDHKSRDVSNNARSQEDEKSVIEETTKLEQGKDMLEPNTDRDLKLSQSPTIPSFSTSSAINSFPVRRASSSLSASSATTLSPDRSNRSCENGFSTTKVLRSPSRSPCGSRTPFERVRQHLFGTSDVHVKTEESKESEEVLGSLPSGLKSDVQIAHLPQLHSLPHPPQQQEYLTKSRKHHRYSSGTTKPRSTHTVSASMPASPKIISLGRLMPFNTSSPTLPTDGLFTSASSSSNPFSDAPRASSVSTLHMPPLPPFPVAPSPTSNISHHTHTRTRSGFSSRKLSEVLFSSSSSISLSASPRSGSATSQARPSSRSSRRTFMSRSISVGARDRSKYNISNSVKPPQPRTQLTDQEKVDKWNDLLARSARAGGTLHLAADSGLLGSDDIQVEPENRG